MNHRAAFAPAGAAILLLLAGCHHTSKIVDTAQPAPPAIGPVMVSVPPPTHHDRPEVAVSVTPPPASSPEPTRRSRPARKTAPASSASGTTQASSTPAPVVNSPPPISLGELSAGGEVSSALRQQTAELLKSQQQRLDTMSRSVASAHTTEIAQARTFLQNANTSWNAADYEGAHTLVIKAKVLLDDLKQ